MKVICSATLTFQAIVFALAIPVAAALRPGVGGWVAALLMVMALVGAMTARRGDIIVGSVTQVVSVLASVVIPIALVHARVRESVVGAGTALAGVML